MRREASTSTEIPFHPPARTIAALLVIAVASASGTAAAAGKGTTKTTAAAKAPASKGQGLDASYAARVQKLGCPKASTPAMVNCARAMVLSKCVTYLVQLASCQTSGAIDTARAAIKKCSQASGELYQILAVHDSAQGAFAGAYAGCVAAKAAQAARTAQALSQLKKSLDQIKAQAEAAKKAAQRDPCAEWLEGKGKMPPPGCSLMGNISPGDMEKAMKNSPGLVVQPTDSPVKTVLKGLLPW
jgi:hypothetical protein